MTILELQEKLQKTYDKCGDIEVVVSKNIDWEITYHLDILQVDTTVVNGNNVVAISTDNY